MVCLIVACLPSAASAAPLLGVGEQESPRLDNPLFKDLGVKHQRITIPWDATDGSWPLHDADRWLLESRRLGLEVLVVFGHSRMPARKKILPSPAAYLARFRAFRARYPWVTQFATWNEANFKGQPTYRNPRRVAQYYLALRKECPGCTVLTASLLDTSNLITYTKAMQRLIGKGSHIWGFHNYADLALYRDKTTRRFLKATRGPVWIVEAGGLVHYRSRKGGNMNRRPASESSQRKVLRYLTGPMLKRNPRLRRVYVYQWQTGSSVTWDSGLLRPDGTARPGYWVLREALGKGLLSL